MPSPPGSSTNLQAGTRPESETRALLRIMSTQAANANPLVAVVAISLIYTMHDRVDAQGLLAWATLAVLVGVSRLFISRHVRSSLASASEAQLQRSLRAMVWGAACNSVVMGSAYWLIYSPDDPYVSMVVTMVSVVHMIALLQYLMPRVRDRLFGAAGNVVQGVLFWLGVGTSQAPQWELLLVYLGLFWCGLVAGREQLRQFRESLRVRDENADLLQRLEQERATVQRALEEARRANASKNRFLAAASHDLRQPLHALTMFLGTLGFHMAGEEGRRLLGRATATVRVLDEQFNSLLDLSRFDAGAVVAKPRAFRLDELLQRLAGEVRPQAEQKGLSLTTSAPPALACSDPLLLGRLLHNLLDNAVHYTSQGGVSLRCQRNAGGYSLEVRDTGPGIPPEEQARVFDEYVQLDNPGRQRQRGVGLGLAIVRRIEQLLDLKLQLYSSPGAGTCFTLQVPAADSQAEAPPGTVAADPLAFRTSVRVWILDDDQDVLEGLQGQLQAWGAQVEAFGDPLRLIEELRRQSLKPDWILTDDMLGARWSGLEVAQAVTRDHAAVRVCLVTGNTEPARLAELGASGLPVMIKPVTPERLITLLDGDAVAAAEATTAA